MIGLAQHNEKVFYIFFCKINDLAIKEQNVLQNFNK